MSEPGKLDLLVSCFVRSSTFSDFNRVHELFKVICAFPYMNVNFKTEFYFKRSEINGVLSIQHKT